MESGLQRKISICALIVSILSLAFTVITSIYQYKENIEVVVGAFDIVAIDLDDRSIECQVEIIVANASHATTSLLQIKGYIYHPGFQPAEPVEVELHPNLPITLVQGGAERLVANCKYSLNDEQLSALERNENIQTVLKDDSISIRLFSTKDKCYYANARFENAKTHDMIAEA